MRPQLLSLMIHVAAIALLVTVSTILPDGPSRPRHDLAMRQFDTRLVFPAVDHGGGGGGEQSTLPATRGRLPKFAKHQFTPPSATPRDTNPELPVEPALVALVEIQLPEGVLPRLGDPLGTDGPASSGPGKHGGIGGGSEGGVGNHRGPGYGGVDGFGFSPGGSAGGLTAPRVVYRVEPEFSEEARKAKYQGTVILSLDVDENGNPTRLHILSGLGLGLDEKAIEAVSRWKFKPALRNGRPVSTPATIEVNFRLL